MKILFFLLFSVQVWAQMPKSDYQKILARFEAWQVEERQKGRFAKEGCCSPEAMFSKECEGSSRIGMPKDFNLYFGDINRDGKMDALATYRPYPCDGGKLLRDEQDWVLMLSKGADYEVNVEYGGQVKQSLVKANLFIQDVAGASFYGVAEEYAPEDPNCCPSISKKFWLVFPSTKLNFEGE